MAFMASVEETPDTALSEPGPSLPEDEDHLGGESTQEGDEGLYIPSFLEEALGVTATSKLIWPILCRHKRSVIGSVSSASQWAIL